MTDRRQPVGSGHTRATRSGPSSESTDEAEPIDRDVAGDGKLPTPAWIPTDDVIGPASDRQVLVVGDTPTGVALTRLLRRAGYDPVLAAHPNPPAVSRVALLSPAATEVLGTLDAGRRLLDRGVPIESVDVRVARSDDTDGRTIGPGSDDTGRAPTVAVPTRVLYRTLDAALPEGVPARDRTVESVSTGDDGIAVQFDDGVREWFDLVVDAGVGQLRSPGSDDSAGRHGIVHQFEATVDRHNGPRIRDLWLPNALLQRLPAATGDRTLVRITAAASGSPTDERAIETAIRRSDTSGALDSGAFDREPVRQTRLPDGAIAEGWWGHGRVARCGRAACPVAPAAGVGVSLGITDALGLVSVLARHGRTVPRTTEAYAANRARRFEALERATTRTDHAVSAPEPLRSLGALRAMALEALAGTPPSALRSGSQD